MVCRDVRELADAFLSDQLLVETTNDVVRHLETCPTCRDEIAATRTLRSRLQSAFANAPELAARPEFLEALPARLREATGGGMSRRDWLRSWWAAAAGAAIAVSGGLLTRRSVHRSRLAALAREAAGDHQNCAIRFNLAERPISLEEAARRYDSSYAGLAALEPPTGLPAGAMQVLDRHSCVYQGRRFAHVVFRQQGRLVSLLVTASTEGESPAPALLAAEGAWSVAAFSSARHQIFVVSDLGDRDTLIVARALSGPVVRQLGDA